MHLVFNHVTQLQHVSYAHSSCLVKLLTCTTITKISLTVARQSCLVCPLIQIFHGSTVENRSRKFHAQRFSGTSEYSFKNLTNVHTRRHTQRIQHDVNRSTISQERHIFLTNNTGYNTFVTVATSHLITHTNLTFLSNIYFCHLDNTSRKFITNCNSKLLTFQFSIQLFIFLNEIHHQITNHTVNMIVTCPVAQLNRSKVK